MLEPQYVVLTSAQDRPVAGLDAMIASLPEQVWQRLSGFDADVQSWVLMGMLRQMSREVAAKMGERLHHADWWVTRDPELIEQIGMAHDCVSCRASVDQALAHVAEKPDEDLVAGVLYWAG